jgi:uncharacterized protein involved in exopolysaccharide biosynthesis
MDDFTPSNRVSDYIKNRAPIGPVTIPLLQSEWLQRDVLRRFTIGFVAVAATVAIAWPFLPRRYEAATTIVLRPVEQTEAREGIQSLRHALDDSAVQSEIDRISSPALAAQVIARHNLANDPEFTRQGWLSSRPMDEADLRRRLMSHLTVAREKRSYTIRIGYSAGDPVKASAMTRTLVSAYLDDQVARKRETLSNQTYWLKQRADSLQGKYDEAQKKMLLFSDTSGLIDSGAQISLESQLSILSTELAQAKARQIEASSRFQSLSAMKVAGTLESAPEVLASPSVQRLKEAHATARSKMVVLDPELQALATEIAAESDRIVQGAVAEMGIWTNRERMLQDEIKSVREGLVERRRNAMRLDELQREAAADRTALDETLVRLKGQIGREGEIRPDAEVISQAEPPRKATFPNPLLTGIGVLLAASLAGAAAAWELVTRRRRRKVNPSSGPLTRDTVGGKSTVRVGLEHWAAISGSSSQ